MGAVASEDVDKRFAMAMMHLTFGLAAAADWRAGRPDSRKTAFTKSIYIILYYSAQ